LNQATLGDKNMKLTKLILCLLLVSNTGCLAKSPEKISITNSNERIEIFGLSMLPPQEDGWFYEKLTPGKIEFGKAISKEKSFVIQVSLSRLPAVESKEEFIRVLSDQRQRNAGNPRYETLINDEIFSEEKKVPALRFHTKYKDKGSPHLPKGEAAFIVEDYGIFCMHPKGGGDISANIVCSQRSLEGKERTDWEKVANEFIQNVEFIDFPTE
jgi:hypothetical protein